MQLNFWELEVLKQINVRQRYKGAVNEIIVKQGTQGTTKSKGLKNCKIKTAIVKLRDSEAKNKSHIVQKDDI
jgi:hypothetical protein